MAPQASSLAHLLDDIALTQDQDSPAALLRLIESLEDANAQEPPRVDDVHLTRDVHKLLLHAAVASEQATDAYQHLEKAARLMEQVVESLHERSVETLADSERATVARGGSKGRRRVESDAAHSKGGAEDVKGELGAGAAWARLLLAAVRGLKDFVAGNAVAAVEGVDVTNSGEFEVDVGREPNKDERGLIGTTLFSSLVGILCEVDLDLAITPAIRRAALDIFDYALSHHADNKALLIETFQLHGDDTAGSNVVGLGSLVAGPSAGDQGVAERVLDLAWRLFHFVKTKDGQDGGEEWSREFWNNVEMKSGDKKLSAKSAFETSNKPVAWEENRSLVFKYVAQDSGSSYDTVPAVNLRASSNVVFAADSDKLKRGYAFTGDVSFNKYTFTAVTEKVLGEDDVTEAVLEVAWRDVDKVVLSPASDAKDASRSVRLVCLRPPSLDGRVLATSDEQQFIAFEVPANFKPATLNKILGARKLAVETSSSASAVSQQRSMGSAHKPAARSPASSAKKPTPRRAALTATQPRATAEAPGSKSAKASRPTPVKSSSNVFFAQGEHSEDEAERRKSQGPKKKHQKALAVATESQGAMKKTQHLKAGKATESEQEEQTMRSAKDKPLRNVPARKPESPDVPTKPSKPISIAHKPQTKSPAPAAVGAPVPKNVPHRSDQPERHSAPWDDEVVDEQAVIAKKADAARRKSEPGPVKVAQVGVVRGQRKDEDLKMSDAGGQDSKAEDEVLVLEGAEPAGRLLEDVTIDSASSENDENAAPVAQPLSTSKVSSKPALPRYDYQDRPSTDLGTFTTVEVAPQPLRRPLVQRNDPMKRQGHHTSLPHLHVDAPVEQSGSLLVPRMFEGGDSAHPSPQAKLTAAHMSPARRADPDPTSEATDDDQDDLEGSARLGQLLSTATAEEKARMLQLFEQQEYSMRQETLRKSSPPPPQFQAQPAQPAPPRLRFQPVGDRFQPLASTSNATFRKRQRRVTDPAPATAPGSDRARPRKRARVTDISAETTTSASGQAHTGRAQQQDAHEAASRQPQAQAQFKAGTERLLKDQLQALSSILLTKFKTQLSNIAQAYTESQARVGHKVMSVAAKAFSAERAHKLSLAQARREGLIELNAQMEDLLLLRRGAGRAHAHAVEEE